ncbi:MAG: methyltransferase [Negativicutes bacterium]|nr:methyltransferase [Negativicutes bacterium]
MLSTRIEFLHKFMQSPRKIGSITPSSAFLTREMLSKLPWDNIETIIELGAGTGVFTDFIAENKKASCQVLVVEEDDDLRKALHSMYPMFHYGAKAEKLDWLVRRYNLPQADCIISGLPFAAFSELLRNTIIGAVDRCLKPEGAFVAFQYSLHMRKILKKKFSEVQIDLVPLNFPPAFVYHCKK